MREDDCDKLSQAVANTLWHQSQPATDCRWLRVLCAVVRKKINFIGPTTHNLEEILKYPDFGDMRQVTSVRANEIIFHEEDQKYDWHKNFWEECFKKTPCQPATTKINLKSDEIITNLERISGVYINLINHFIDTIKTTNIDPEHDISFGFGFYGLTLLKGILKHNISYSIESRLILRTLSEIFITLKYLVHKNNPDLWNTFYSYGYGQAKLVSLKLEEQGLKTGYINQDDLENLINEDKWEEFREINFGHWCKTDLDQWQRKQG